MIIYGPVPSRRFGRSLGINNIPSKYCSYQCVYCQVGATLKRESVRRAFYSPDEIRKEVEDKIKAVKSIGEKIDYLSFVPDGEPTLDINLGNTIDLLKKYKIKIAVITNSSLINNEDVQADLMKADLVSVKVDSVTEDIWEKINQPATTVELNKIKQGILDFSKRYKGTLLTETMFISDVNDSEDEIQKISEFIAEIKPNKSYLAVPTRPPLQTWVKPVSGIVLFNAYKQFKHKNINTEFLSEYEGDKFTYTGNIEENILSITAVHPMQKDAVKALLKKANKDWIVIENLISEGKLIEKEYENKKFYIRKH
jgi:wyosine [tRNA(Phe)-imidazoG37] synthetase (radical SAM superfamily)